MAVYQPDFWCQRCEAAGIRAWLSFEALDHLPQRRLVRSSLLHLACRKWIVGCSSSFPSGYDDVSPERLWEVCGFVAISFLFRTSVGTVYKKFKGVMNLE